eukprot:s1134_g2.t1
MSSDTYSTAYLAALDHGRSSDTDVVALLQQLQQQCLSRRSPDSMTEAAYSLPHRSHRCLGALAAADLGKASRPPHACTRVVVTTCKAGLKATTLEQVPLVKARCNYALDYSAFSVNIDDDAVQELGLSNGIRSSYDCSSRQVPALDAESVRKLGLQHLLCSLSCQASHSMCNRTWLPLEHVRIAIAPSCKIVASQERGTPLHAVDALSSFESAAGVATVRLLCERLASKAVNARVYGEPASVFYALQCLLVSKVTCAQHCLQASAYSVLDGKTLLIAHGDHMLLTCIHDVALTGAEAALCDLQSTGMMSFLPQHISLHSPPRPQMAANLLLNSVQDTTSLRWRDASTSVALELHGLPVHELQDMVTTVVLSVLFCCFILTVLGSDPLSLNAGK